MKAIAINGSPRRGWNTEQMLNEALRGAAEAGADTQLVQLYDLSFTGCRSCFACKRIGAQPCLCYWKDDLSPLLEHILSADMLFLGSPIYFGDVSAQVPCLLERLGFLLMTYDDYQARLFDGQVDVGVFLTMNVSVDWYEQQILPSLERHLSPLRRLNGRLEICPACDTLQFSEYATYHSACFNEAHKRKVHQEQFPRDLQAAFELGRQLAAEHLR